MARKFLILLALAFVWTACGEAASSDTAPADPPVYVSSAAELSWSVQEVTYARALSHEGDYNAAAATEVDLVGDLYLPEPAEGLRPALLIIHGGGFLGGTRKQAELVDFAEYFAARGWVVFSIDYRVAPDHGTSPAAWIDMVESQESSRLREDMGKAIYPAVRDAKAAVRWLQAYADDYAISTRHIAAMGGSAGAHISVALGVSDPADFRDELSAEQDPTLASTNPEQSGRVAAVLDFWGGTEPVQGLHDAFDGPTRWDAADAPVLIVHGTADRIVPIERGQEIRDAYDASGAAYEYVEIQNAGHGPWGAMVGDKNLRELGEAFLLEHLDLTER